VEAGKIFAYIPRPPSLYIGRAIPRYRLRRLHIPKFCQSKRLSHRASAFSSLHSIPFPLFSLPSTLSLLARQFSYPPLPSSLCLSLFPFLLSRGGQFSSSRSFLLAGAMCIRKYESFVALSTTAFLELSAIVRE